MSRFIRFSEYFKKVLEENITTTDAGISGDGSGFSPNSPESKDSHARNDSRTTFPLFGAGKVLTRFNKKSKKKEKKTKARIPSENEESTVTHITNGKETHKFDSVEKALTMYDSLGGAAAGWKVVTPKKRVVEGVSHTGYEDTTWSDGKLTITMQDVEDKLTELESPVISIPVKDIAHLDIHTRHKPNKTSEQVKSTYDRAMKADLKYPIIITYSNGKYDMIIDGNHRLHKAVELGDDNIQAKVLDLSKVSDEWLGVFG